MKKKLLFFNLIFLLSGCTFQNIIQKEESLETSNNVVFSNQVVEIKTENNTIPPTTIQEAVAKVYDSVVVINSTLSNGTSAGSGVILAESEDYSYIVTCHHVIEGASQIKVTLSDSTSYMAVHVAGDPTTDIAVVAIKAKGLKVAAYTENFDNVKVGSTAIAIGNPLGLLANTVTTGIVSSINRSVTTSDGTVSELLQTDAAINSGNSGGGLFNSAGELIGIVSAKYAASGVEGLGFAVPSNVVKEMNEQLCKNGYIEGRVNLGATFSQIQVPVSFFQTKIGIGISSMDSNGCAANLLKVGDLIEKIEVSSSDDSKNKQTLSNISNPSQINGFIRDLNLTIGDKLLFTITRNNTQMTVEVTLKQYKYIMSF